MNSFEPVKVENIPDPLAAGAGSTEHEGTPLELVNIVLAHRMLVVGFGLLCGLAVVGYELVQERSYTTSMSFIPQARSAQAPSGAAGLAAQFGLSLPGSSTANSPLLYADLMKTKTILGAVADHKYQFRRDTGLFSGTLAELYRSVGDSRALWREEALRKLAIQVYAEAALKTGMVTVRVTAEDPSLAEQLARQLLAELNQFNLTTRQSQAAAERKFTERRLREVEVELRLAQDKLETFLQQNREIRQSPALSFKQERLNRVVLLREQVYSSLAQALEQAKIEEVRDTPVITVVEQPTLPLRPDRRGLVKKGLLAVLAGALLGLVVVFGRTYMARGRGDASAAFTEFRSLSQDSLDDLLHPWRPLERILRGSRK